MTHVSIIFCLSTFLSTEYLCYISIHPLCISIYIFLLATSIDSSTVYRHTYAV
ncbi:uncharacterized protein C8R40DRAFT_526884 [Lentinula edodes]|uniref:uncharacterized protein n=1 Tax=Lentinula edodes TaxID=5353 RepID=UPI001E8E7DF6|nr:uncharacterized protein C8R40DRAFT_526884 [Lentinula edodes]KAH7871708.1 hypothetical protein C8R40DRAFT_526884 [Lentinula edodes]